MFFFRLFSRLPFFVLYFISDVLYCIAFYIIGYRKSVVWENLKNAFPEKSEKELKTIRRSFYRNLTDIIVESLKTLTISEKELSKRVALKNFDLLNQQLLQGQSIIAMTSHQCNWEWILVRAELGLEGVADGVYKPLTNKFFDKLMLGIRGRFGSFMLPMQQVPRSLVTRKNITRTIALVADQTPAPETAYWSDFLNQDTAFYTGGAKIAISLGYPVFFIEMKRQKRGFYEVSAKVLSMPPYQNETIESITEKYVRLAEKSVQANPADWLWSHKRWKHKRSQISQ
jgi:KDO2-lipid IV(A) lauroyltransferase